MYKMYTINSNDVDNSDNRMKMFNMDLICCIQRGPK